jgi:LPXTG-motif cell wall-anchored protein
MPLTAHGQTNTDPLPSDNSGGDYVTTTLPERSIDVSGFSPECVRNAPYIRYTFVPRGFVPTPSRATLSISDRSGNVVHSQVINSFSGNIVWPGASVDSSGNATDWPGWKLAGDGVSWIPDPSDTGLREGLTIKVTVDPSATATATVAYPAATSPCASPPSAGDPTAAVPPATTTTCVPGSCELPRTGSSGPASAIIIGAAALLAGVLILTATRRRHEQHGSSTST